MRKNLFLFSAFLASLIQAGNLQTNYISAPPDRNSNTNTGMAEHPAATGKIIFFCNGGSGNMETLSGLSEGQEYQLPRNTFTRSGYRFVGWTNDPNGQEPLFQDEFANFTYYSGNSRLYAIWEPEATALQISFHANGGEGSMKPLYVRANQTIIIPPHRFTPAREGYECKGFGNAPDDYNRYSIGGTARFSRSCTLYAFWSPQDGSIGGNSEKYKGQSVFIEGVHIAPEDWVQTSERPVKKFAEWKKGCGWYDTSQTWLNFCWAGTCSNAIHWWLDRNREYIRKYKETHDIPDFAYYGKGVSDVFRYFTKHWLANEGGFPHYGFNWFINGIDSHVQESAKGKGGIFKDVFGEHTLVRTLGSMNRRSFTQFVTEALENNRGMSLDETNFSGGHAITCWGAEYDDEGFVSALYYSDSATPWDNSLTGKDLSLGKITIKYHQDENWKPYMATQTLIGDEILEGEIPMTRIYSYDQGKEYWEAYFATQGKEKYTLTSRDAAGKTFDSQTVQVAPDADISLPVYPFRTIVKATAGEHDLTISPQGTIHAADAVGKTIILEYADKLPFEVSTTDHQGFVQTHWYLFGSEQGKTPELMQYDAQNQEHIRTSSFTEGDLFGDANLWCISGTVTDGFRLYNKAGGSRLAVAYTDGGGKAAMHTAEEEQTLWHLTAAPGTDTEGTFRFKSATGIHENIFLNISGNEVTFGTTDSPTTELNTLTPTECLAHAASAFEKKLQQIPEGAVGGPSDRNATAQAIEMLKKQPSEANYQAVRTAFEQQIVLSADKTYYLVDAEEKNRIAVQKDGSFRTGTASEPVAGGHYIFEPTSDNRYHIRIQGEYLGAAKSNSQNNSFGLEGRSLNGSPIKKGTFSLIAETSARFYLQNTNTEAKKTSYVHLNGDRLEACADRVSGTRWHLVEAPSLEITIGKAGYATLHVPFAVQLPQDGSLKAYTATASSDGSTHRLLLTEWKGNRIPANTPVILSGAAQTYTLTTSARQEGDDRPANDLSGTLLPTDITTADYILGEKNGTIGFYKVAAEDRELGGNKAYLPGIHLPASAQGAEKFILSVEQDGDGTTGIGSGAADLQNDEEYYDLQGRRVLHPTKGIYVTKSGKKVLFIR